jgi:lipoate-protein ligase B
MGNFPVIKENALLQRIDWWGNTIAAGSITLQFLTHTELLAPTAPVPSLMLRRAFTTACPSSIPRTVNGTLSYLSLGSVPYGKALALQRHLVKRRHDLNNKPHDPADPTIRDILLLVEHPPTFTAGRRIKGRSELEEEARLKQLGADYYETLRGGQITFHGPGQLVGYPILDIRDYQVTNSSHGYLQWATGLTSIIVCKLNVRCFVSYLEKAVIETCRRYGIQAKTTENTGVWVGDDHKIAALGMYGVHYADSVLSF